MRRGLGDLLAEHDTAIPFLDEGPKHILSTGAGPAGIAETPAADLLEALALLITQRGHAEQMTRTDDTLAVERLLKATCTPDGLTLVARDTQPLPLVGQDLASPSLAKGTLTRQRRTARVTIREWRLDARQFMERLIEHWETNGRLTAPAPDATEET